MGSAAPPPIIGTPIDPPSGAVPAFAEKLDRTTVGGIGYRTLRRYTYAKVGLLAAGTAYFMFLSLLSLLAFAYGIIAVVGADELAAEAHRIAQRGAARAWWGRAGSIRSCCGPPAPPRASSAWW